MYSILKYISYLKIKNKQYEKITPSPMSCGHKFVWI